MPSSIGSPRSAAVRTPAGEVQATSTSGPPVCVRDSDGLGTTGTSRKAYRSPEASTRGSRSQRTSRSSIPGSTLHRLQAGAEHLQVDPRAARPTPR
ncbi:hypothetical protein SGLAM104S_04367 [Streptomyces glaucescens]